MAKVIKPLPPINALREALSYNPDTGELRWRTARRGCRVGDIAGTKTKKYISVTLDGQHYAYHRIAWALYHNEDPYPLEIDHANRNPQDNTIRNLRRATAKENCENRCNNNRHMYRRVRITYPDGRGVVVVDSIATAARVLNLKYNTIQQHLRDGRTTPLLWGNRHRQSSGILVCYEM